MIAHTCTLSKKPGSFAQGLSLPPSICLHRTADPVASCTLAILVYTLLWIVELHRLCMHTYTWHLHTHTFFHTDCFLATPPKPWRCVHSCKHGFLWVLVCFPPTHTLVLVWEWCLQNSPSPQEFTLGPTYSVVREWDEGSILFPLLCFSLASWQTPTHGECKYTKLG